MSPGTQRKGVGMKVNGKEYPLWSQFVERKDEWIGGKLVDSGDSHDRMFSGNESPASTKITDIQLIPNGKESAYFQVVGEDFGCGFDVGLGGVVGGEDGWITFSGYGGHRWQICQRKWGA